MGESIKELRKSLGVTQEAFAGTFHIPLRTLQNWEGGFRKPPEYVMELIVKWVREGNFQEELEQYKKAKEKRAYENKK